MFVIPTFHFSNFLSLAIFLLFYTLILCYFYAFFQFCTVQVQENMDFWERKVGSYTGWFTHNVLIYYYFIVLSYKVRPYPEPFLFYFCNSDYFTIYKHVYTKETCFPKFFSIFLTKKRKFTTKGKTNAGRRGGGGDGVIFQG
jgi:hypothetical protein